MTLSTELENKTNFGKKMHDFDDAPPKAFKMIAYNSDQILVRAY